MLYRCAHRTARLRVVCRFMDFRETRSWRRLGWGTFDEMKLQGVFRWTRVCSFHFLESDYHGSGRQINRQTSRQNSFLKRDSVPTKFDCFPERLRRPADQGANKRKAPTERLEPPPTERTPPKGKRVSPVKDQLRTVMKLTWMFLLLLLFLLRVQLRQHLIHTTTVMVLITTCCGRSCWLLLCKPVNGV